jgi:dTMP kinase
VKILSGKLIVIEGSDGSGKATQTQMLYDKLVACRELTVKKIEFPDYKSESSALIKMYLEGEFGTNPNLVNPFVVSTFYAVDRFISYEKKWKDFYRKGGIVIADRYTTSNMIHQAAKISDRRERDDYLNWLGDLEFNRFKLPIPDGILFLNMPPQYSIKLLQDRPGKYGEKTGDIHERNLDYLVASYNNSLEIAKKYQWLKIDCFADDNIRSIEEIHQEICTVVEKIINKKNSP